MENNNNQNRTYSGTKGLSLAVVIGVAIGTVLGKLMDNMQIGLLLGLVLGIVGWTLLRKKPSSEQAEGESEEESMDENKQR